MYNLVYLLRKKYIEETYNEKQELRVKLYKKRTIYSSIIFIFSLSFILIYGRRMNFSEVLDFKTEDNIVSLEIYGAITGDERDTLSKDEIEAIVSILEDYKYRRTFNIKNIGGNVGFLSIENQEGKYIFIELYENGYLRIPNNKVYLIESVNKEHLYKTLNKVIN